MTDAALPIREQIMQAVQATLTGITKGNGYRFTIKSVQRTRSTGQTKLETPLILIQEGLDTPAEGPLAGSSSATTRHLEITLGVQIAQDAEGDAREGDTVCNLLRADIQKAMAADSSFGELALDSRETGAREIVFTEERADLMFELDYDIHYRHLRTDPSVAV
jgi:hypothetical protein